MASRSLIWQGRKPRESKRQRGQVLIMATLSLTLTFALLGLVVDVGWAHFRKLASYSAAQSASIAGARAAMLVANPTCGGGLTCQSATACPGTLNTPTNPIHAACLYAQQNGFTNGGSQGVLIADNTSGAPVPGVSPSFWISATVSERLPLTFLSVLGQQFVTVAARSTAGVVNGDNCIYALDPARAGAISNQNAVTSSCGLITNSNNATAVQAGPGITAPSISMVGNYNGTIHGTISTGIAPVSDPLAYLPNPTVPPGGCTFTNYTISSGSATLSPGKYCGGITIKGNANVTLNPSTTQQYVLLGGGLNLVEFGQLHGNGVTIYNTFDGTHPYGPIFNQDNALIDLTAPTSGTYAGILFFNDRNAPYTPDNVLGAASAKLQGALYFPSSSLVFSSGAWVPVAYTIIVSRTFNNQINGVTVNNDYSSLANGSPIKAIAVYE
jgi:hypothetical protein